MTSDGRPYQRSLGGVAAAFGFMLFGFFGSLAAELLFCFLFGVPTYTSDVAVNATHWNLWFAGAAFAVFSPIILLLAWRLLRSVFGGWRRLMELEFVERVVYGLTHVLAYIRRRERQC